MKKFTTTAFSDYVKSVKDLYNVCLRNGYFLPKETSSGVNEHMLY